MGRQICVGSRCCQHDKNVTCASGCWFTEALSALPMAVVFVATVKAATAIEAMGEAGAGSGDSAGVDIAASQARGLSQRWPMAHISEYSIVAYERKPGHWRAAISPKVLVKSGAPGLTVHSTVTPDDSASESEANLAATQLIRKLRSQ
jgi:hypothetical protein